MHEGNFLWCDRSLLVDTKLLKVSASLTKPIVGLRERHGFGD